MGNDQRVTEWEGGCEKARETTSHWATREDFSKEVTLELRFQLYVQLLVKLGDEVA